MSARTNVKGAWPSDGDIRSVGASEWLAPKNDGPAAASARTEGLVHNRPEELAKKVVELALHEAIGRAPFLSATLRMLTLAAFAGTHTAEGTAEEPGPPAGKADLPLGKAGFLANGLPIEGQNLLAGHRQSTAKAGDVFQTDGICLRFDPAAVLKEFRRTETPPTHDVLHVLIHCVLLHPFVLPGDDMAAWDMAADLMAELTVADILGKRPGERGEALAILREQLRDDLDGPLSTMRLYQALHAGAYQNTLGRWRDIVHVDDHSPWHKAAQERQDPDDVPASGHAGRPTPQEHGTAAERNATSEHIAQKPARGQGADATSEAARQGRAPKHTPSAAERRWRKTARNMEQELQAAARRGQGGPGNLTRELTARLATRRDYRDFLRRFAVRAETMHVSASEFDPIFYTFGLSLYGNLPLIEPLEFRDERRVRDFVIVLDTSASVDGEKVRHFVDVTYGLLSSADVFASSVNVHVIQADAAVQDDTVLHTPHDLKLWQQSVELRGFGGTDFRPAFQYVDSLIEHGVMERVDGLLYLTDGWGVYPTRAPSYPVVFVLYDDGQPGEEVPPWAMHVTLDAEEFGSRTHKPKDHWW